ncbi:MAG: interleukin-like EMT inducer domain-containing protein [Caldilineaceae bacterium]
MHRSWFARGRRRAGLALAIYTLLALVLTWPLAAHFTTHVTGDGIDDPALAWNLWWVKLRLVDQLNPDLFHSGWMFHPVDINLAFYTLTPLNGLLSIPLQLVFGLTVANNLLLLSSFVLGGFGTYLLVRQLLKLWGWDTGAGYWAALLAGGIYAFASAKLFYAALGQFNIASSQWIPFCALYLVRMVQAEGLRPKLREAAFAGLFLVFQAWAELTYASFLLLLVGLLFLWAMLFGRGWRGRLHDIAAFLLAGGIFVLGILPFLAAMAPDLAAEGDFFGRGGGFADVFSADLLGYLMPTRLHPWLGAWVAGLSFPNDKGQQIYLGYGVLLLALMGAWGLWRGVGGSNLAGRATTRRWLLFWGAAAVLFFLLTLGPQLRWAGQSLPVPGPFALVSRLPFFSGNRYPSRYSVMLLLAAAVLAGAGAYWLLARPWVRAHKGWAAAAALGGIACLVLLEHLSIPLPLSDQHIPAIYSRLAAEARSGAQANTPGTGPDTGALLELPTGWRNGARVLGKSDLMIMAQQLYQTEHGLRRLGGNTSRNPEFKFQYFTDAPLLGDLIALFNADQPHIAPVIDGELDAMIARDRLLAARVLEFLGIRYVTVDVEKSPPALLRYVNEALPLALVAEAPGLRADGSAQTIRLYEVETSLPMSSTVSATQRIAMDDPLAHLYLGEGWSPSAGAPVRYAMRAEPTLLVDVPSTGARLILEWAVPPAELTATVDGRAVAATTLDTEGRRWALDVPPGAGDRPVDHVVLQVGGPGIAANEVSTPPSGQGWRVGTTGVELAPGNSLLLRSAGEETGDFAHIWLNGIDVADGERGYNLVAVDASGKLLGHAVFDTLATADASAALAAWLRSWPQGTMIGGAVRDEASLKLGQDAVDALHGIGVTTDLRSKFRWSHAFVGAAGAAPGTALEDANLLRPAVVAVGPALNGPRVYGALAALEIDQTGYQVK